MVEGKGLMGWLTKLFMPKSALQQMSAGIQKAEGAMDTLDAQKRILATGAPGKASVIKIQDTGAMINFNPVVLLTLKVKPASGDEFETTVTTPVSKIAVPRVGDVVDVRFNPANHGEVAIVA
jgi:hypothetical protein